MLKMRPIFQHIDLFLSELLGQLQGVDDFIVLFIAAVGGHAQGQQHFPAGALGGGTFAAFVCHGAAR